MEKYLIITAEKNPDTGRFCHSFKIGEIVTRVDRSNFFSNGEYTQLLVSSEYALIEEKT